MSEKKRAPRPREAYPLFTPVQTRWMDNDIYGHVNNVVYYSYFDTVINRFLIAEGGLDIERGPVIGVVAESHCRYSSGLAFPMDIEAGLFVSKLGRSSVRYEIGLFAAGSSIAAAEGWFVHVFVDRENRRPVAIPDRLREALSRIFVVGERG